MARKLPILRSAMITTTAALITGSTADTIAQSTATRPPPAGQMFA